MENIPEIFPPDIEQKRERYSRGIATARTSIYIFATLCLLVAGHQIIYQNTSGKIFGISGLLYFALGSWSRAKPFVAMLIMSIILSLMILLALMAILVNPYLSIVRQGITLLLFSVFNVLIFRGLLFARKMEKMYIF